MLDQIGIRLQIGNVCRNGGELRAKNTWQAEEGRLDIEMW